MKDTSTTIHDDAARFYGVLQTLQEESRGDAAQLLPVAERQVEKHRVLLAELRELAARVEADLQRWATTSGELRANVDPTFQRPGVELGGKALAVIAARVLEESGKPQPIHYRDIQEQVELAGYTISGADAQATLLSAISRSPNWEPIGGRTGLWKLADGDA